MARVAALVTNFTAGEISPRLEGRVDLAKYRDGCRIMNNMVPQVYGGARRRPGTRFVAEVKDSDRKTRLLPFIFSTTQAYIVEVGHEYMRFYKDGGQIVSGSPAAPVEIVTPYTEAQLADLQWVQSADVMWLTHPSHKPRKLSRTSHTAWTLTEADIRNGPFLTENATSTTLKLSAATGTGVTMTASASLFQSGHVGSVWRLRESSGALPYRTWAAATLVKANELRKFDGHVYKMTSTVSSLSGTYERSGIQVKITATNHGLITGQRVTLDFTSGDATDGYYGVTVIDKDTVEVNDLVRTGSAGFPSGVVSSSGNVTITRDALATGNSSPIHTEGTVSDGQVDWQYLHDGSVTVQVTAYSSATAVTVSVLRNTAPDSVVDSNTTTYWSEGAFSAVRGYPATAAFFEQRLFYAATTYQPQTIWGSVSADFDNHQPGIEDDAALSYTISADDVQTIRALVPGKVLTVMTQSGEFVVRATTADAPLTPTNFSVTRASAFGMQGAVRPRQVGNVVLFLQAGGRKLRELVYDFNSDAYVAQDMTLLAEHITANRIVDMAWQREPDPILWCVRGDGRILGMTYDRAQNVVAWHRHQLGGNAANYGDTLREAEDGTLRVTENDVQRMTESYDDRAYAPVDAIASLPRIEDDQIWVVVKRLIGGSFKRYVEYMTNLSWTDATDAVHLDSSLEYDGDPVDTVSGLDHLEGEEVEVWTDGATHPARTVSSGSITLDRFASKIQAGLPYVSELQTGRLELGAQDGTSQGRRTRIHQVVARVLDSATFEIGPDPDTTDPAPLTPATGETLYTGEVEVSFPVGWSTEGRVYMRQTGPAPFNVLLLAPRLVVHEQ
jgi:hypothetical protein